MCSAPTNRDAAIDMHAIARCLRCSVNLEGRSVCPSCGVEFLIHDGILDAIGPLSGNNLVAASFYDGPAWPRFRPWERGFLRVVGGRERARREILSHLPDRSGACILEVGIGDGENVDLLPKSSSIYGVDLARTQLAACRDRHPRTAGKLAWSEAEALPFADASFDACYSIGGFNYFRDPIRATDEMRRVTKRDGVVLIADERPDLKRFGLGHLLGLPGYDAWWMRRLGLPDEFVAMVLASDIDINVLLARMSPEATRLKIWKRLGYLLIDPNPSWRPS